MNNTWMIHADGKLVQPKDLRFSIHSSLEWKELQSIALANLLDFLILNVACFVQDIAVALAYTFNLGIIEYICHVQMYSSHILDLTKEYNAQFFLGSHCTPLNLISTLQSWLMVLHYTLHANSIYDAYLERLRVIVDIGNQFRLSSEMVYLKFIIPLNESFCFTSSIVASFLNVFYQ